MADRQTIWREDNRIRATDGGGYSDRVRDAQIAQHAYDSRSTDVERAFARATLAIREFERAANSPATHADTASEAVTGR